MADESLPLVCKQEILAGYRWGQHGEMAGGNMTVC